MFTKGTKFGDIIRFAGLEVLQNVKCVGGKENKQMTDLNRFIEWSKNNPRCTVDIEIGGQNADEAGKIRKIWVYSFALGVGQYVNSVDEIDLSGKRKKDMERLRDMVEKYFQQEEKVQVM